jgi:hypothetical protein
MRFLFADASPARARLGCLARAARFDSSESLFAESVFEVQGDDLRALATNLISHGRGFAPSSVVKTWAGCPFFKRCGIHPERS